MNTDYKTGKLLQIIKEWEARGLSEFEISGTEISRAVFFYREANKKFVPIPKGSYTVTMLDNSKADKLLITNIDIQTKAVEYQICYEDEQISSLYIEDFPELDVLVGKYNDVVNDIRNIIQLLKTIGMKSDTSQMTQVLTKLQVNTFWYLNENGELDAFPIGDLNSKYQDMLENMKTNVEQTLNSVHQALKVDLENLIRNYNTVVEQAKEHIDNTKTSAETTIDNKKVQSIDALNTLKQDLENQLNTLKNDLSSNLSSELQTHLQNLANSVNQYITDNRDILKGDKGDGITNIQQLENNKLRLFYGNSDSVDITLPTVSEDKVVEITSKLYAPKFEKSNIYWGESEEKLATEKAVGDSNRVITRRELAMLGSDKNQWDFPEIENTYHRNKGYYYKHNANNKVYYCKLSHNSDRYNDINDKAIWQERTIDDLYENREIIQVWEGNFDVGYNSEIFSFEIPEKTYLKYRLIKFVIEGSYSPEFQLYDLSGQMLTGKPVRIKYKPFADRFFEIFFYRRGLYGAPDAEISIKINNPPNLNSDYGVLKGVYLLCLK